jgi:hypothetical protein
MGWITASLTYNPYCDLPPKVWHSISIEIEPLALGPDAAMPEYETTVDSNIVLDGLHIERHKWNSLDGTFTFDDDQNSSFYVSSAHNPVTVRELTLRYRDNATYDVDATATFHFEFEGAGYADETTRLVFPAVHRGFCFCVPRWNEPDEVAFPADWGVPSTSHDWSPDTIREFAQRYFDLTQFSALTIENGILRAEPTVAMRCI